MNQTSRCVDATADQTATVAVAGTHALRLRTITRNVLSTWSGYVTTLLIGFFLAPFIVHRLGNTGYGVWTLVVSLTGYFGLFDLGLRQSVGRFVAHHVALQDHDGVRLTLSTAIAMLATAGLGALTITIVLLTRLGTTFKIEPQYVDAARIALLIAGINVSIALPMSVFGTILMSLERFDVMNGITVLGAITRASLVFILLRLGHGVTALAAVTCTVSACEYLVTLGCAKRLYPPLAVSWHSVSRAKYKELLGFGVYRFVWIVGNQLIFYSDSVVIGTYLGAGAITYFAIAGSLINYGRNVVSLAADTLFPAASRLDGLNDLAGLRKLHILGTRLGLIIGVPLCCGYLFLGGQFIRLWMGNGYRLSATILVVLTIPQVVSMSQYASSIILFGMSRHKILAQVAVVEGAVNLALSIILAKKIGVLGVAVGTAIPHLISASLAIPWYTLRATGQLVSEYFSQSYAKPLLSAIPTAILCYLLSAVICEPSAAAFGGEVLAICGFYGALTYFMLMTKDERTLVQVQLKRFGLRKGAVPTRAGSAKQI